MLGVNTHNKTLLGGWDNSFNKTQHADSVGVCRGSLGELFQGPVIGMHNEIAIISSLIPKLNKVYYSDDPDFYEISSSDVTVAKPPSIHHKSFRALEIFCQLMKLPWPKGSWSFEGELPVARGMASSTADIIATLRCYAKFMGVSLTHKVTTDVLRQVERSDSVFINQPVLFCSSQNSVIHYFNPIKPLYCLFMHDHRGQVNTEDTRELLLTHYEAHYSEYKHLWFQTITAFEENNLKAICHCSTQSARLSQKVLPKNSFHSLLDNTERFNADGILIAHTGTVIGYLYCEKPSIHLIESVSLMFKSLGGTCELTEIG